MIVFYVTEASKHFREFFNENNLKDFSESPDKLVILFSEDNLLFKRFLKVLFFVKLKGYLPAMEYRTVVSEVFPRKWRYSLVKDLEIKTGLIFPKMSLSRLRMRFLLLSFAVPLIAIVILVSIRVEFILVTLNPLGIAIYLFIIVLPSVLISFISPNFFFPHDWPDVNNFSDLLSDMVIENWQVYRDDNYARTIKEFKEYIEP